MSSLPDERTKVELPLAEQLKGMGWRHLEGDIDVPYLTERQSFREALLVGRLREGIRRINLDESGKPWLDDVRVNAAVGDLERLGAYKLIEANQVATVLLIKGTQVEGDPERHGGREQTVRFIDFENLERNDFLAINQFRVDCPGGRTFIVPDIVLFVNGIPSGPARRIGTPLRLKPPVRIDLEIAAGKFHRFARRRSSRSPNPFSP